MTRIYLGVYIWVAVFSGAPLAAEPGDNSQAAEILNRYLAASENSRSKTLDMIMDAEFEAKIPRLRKEGKLFALRHISSLGRVTYNALRFIGDDTVKKEVIARYLKAEEEAASRAAAVAINPQNYKFRYKGQAIREGKRVHVFELKPHKKQVGLFKGELWIDPETYLAVRESGVLVKNPSLFLKKVEFVRDYEIQDGVSLLTRLNTTIDTRIVGKTQLAIHYFDYRRDERVSQPASNGGSDNQ